MPYQLFGIPKTFFAVLKEAYSVSVLIDYKHSFLASLT